ncbi:c-type cytochrome [Lutibacter sp. A80]|uniref:c-type cytochrome n=1 Tax=Lutibacter sp. A80 TaxID=2918453 RepID=UPI001F05F47F|nr:c-type cytochrome [Lutibacter sp. A80]UMB61234.1 c-type cytochrome [Lutibacter sp. A80]
MKLLKFLLVLTLIFFTACSNNKSNKNISNGIAVLSNNEEGYKLLQKNCYACHSVTSKSHDDIIAPPMIAIKKRYMMSYSTENEFVTAFTKWTLNPNKENALMFGAVQNFKTMPKLPFNEIDMVKIASYVFNNELEKPVWFQSHYNEEHPNGMGNGNGKRRGMQRGF